MFCYIYFTERWKKLDYNLTQTHLQQINSPNRKLYRSILYRSNIEHIDNMDSKEVANGKWLCMCI